MHPLQNVPLAPLSTLGVGGSARWFLRADTVEGVEAAHAWAGRRSVPMFVLGGGSNLVVADGGFKGLVLQVGIGGVSVDPQGSSTLVRVGAGEPWDNVVAAAVDRGLAGLECLSGIPGNAGGTPIQNVGAYGQEVADTLDEVVVFDREAARMMTLAASECAFGYRMSRFKQADAGRFVVCRVTFSLRPGSPHVTYPDVVEHLTVAGVATPTLADVRGAVLAIRRGKGMVLDAADPDTRSVGSFFMNPVVPAATHASIVAAHPDRRVPGFVLPEGAVKIPAAWLIEQAGFARGYQHGAAGLSSKHPLALINRGGATAREVVALATQIKHAVAARFGIRLRPEPIFVGFEDDPEVEYLQRANG